MAGGQALTVLVSPGMESPVAFKTFPGASCTVDNSTSTFRADIDGDALIYVTPTQDIGSAVEAISCSSNGQVTNIQLNLKRGQNPGAIAARYTDIRN
ncbi:MAG: hypothetical protein ACREQC_09965 [Candidatus Binataceae bacterium]